MAGTDSELFLPETVFVVCTEDSQGGATEGFESFTITGKLPVQQTPFSWNQGGNSESTPLSAAATNSLVEMFEAFDSNGNPDGWTINAGTVSTDFVEETTEVVRGSSSLKVLQTNVTDIQYDLTGSLVPGATMCFFIRSKRDGTTTGDLRITLNVNGSDLFTETITYSSSYNNWTLDTQVVTLPDNLGDSQFLQIEDVSLSGTHVYLDAGGLVDFTWHGGVGFAVMSGVNKFLIDDQFSVTMNNDEAGKIQRFMTRAYGWQLPSATSGSETISDP